LQRQISPQPFETRKKKVKVILNILKYSLIKNLIIDFNSERENNFGNLALSEGHIITSHF